MKKNRAAMYQLPCSRIVFDLLDDYYVLRLQAFLPLDDGKFYALTFIQVTVPIANNGVVMDE
jgi:hypothetical protein